jgi:hypothetical protein
MAAPASGPIDKAAWLAQLEAMYRDSELLPVTNEGTEFRRAIFTARAYLERTPT